MTTLSLPNIGIAAIIAFSIINLIIGLYQKKGKPISISNYVAYPNQASYITIVLSVTSTIVGGGMFFAVSQLGYESGVSGIYLGASYLFGLVILGGLAPLIRRKMFLEESETLYDFIDKCFPSELFLSPKRIFAFATLIIFFMFLGAQVLTLSFFINYIYSLSSSQSIFAAASIIFLINTVIYMSIGGLQKDIATDIWQMFLVLVGVILIIFAIDDFSKIKLLDDDYFIGTKAGPILLIGIILFTGPALLARPDMWQRITASKTDSVAKWSFMTAAVLSMLIFWIFTLIGMYANVEGWASGKTALFTLLENNENSYIFIAILLAFLGAVISSADTFLNICSISIYEITKDTKLHIVDDMWTLRISSLIASTLALMVAFGLPDLIDLFAGGFGALFIFLPIVLGSLFNDNPSSKAATYSSSLGLLIYFGFIFIIPREAFLPAFIVSMTVYYAISRNSNKATKT